MRTTKMTADKLNKLGFDKVTFPILIKDGADLNLVSLDQFAGDSDLYLFEFESNYELIDSNGQLWTWQYDKINKTNIPGKFIRTLTFLEVKKVVDTYFVDSKLKDEIKSLTTVTPTTKELFAQLKLKYKI